MHSALAACSPYGCVGYPRPYRQGLNTFKRRAKFVIGAYILVFDFLLKNSFQSDQWLYPFKRLARLLSSHLVHLDHLTPACCTC